MSADSDAQERWGRAIEGEPLTAEERELLRAAAESDVETKADWLADARVDGWLRGLAWDRQDGDAWSTRLEARLRAETDSEAFTAGVATRIRRRKARPRQVAFAVMGACGLLLVWRLAAWGPRPSPQDPHPILTNAIPIGAQDSSNATSTPLATPAGPPAPVLRFDFENGERTPVMLDAPVADCPPRPGSRFCMRAVRYSESHKEIVGVRFQDRARGLFAYGPGVRLTFDYWVGSWVGSRAPGISIWINDRSQRAPYYLNVDQLQPVGWVHVDVSLSDFRPQHPADGVQALRDGDVVDFLLIQTRYSRQDVLFVDDVAVLAPP